MTAAFLAIFLATLGKTAFLSEVMLVGGLSMLIEVMPETCFPCSSKNFIVEALHDSSTGFVKPFEFVYCSPAVS